MCKVAEGLYKISHSITTKAVGFYSNLYLYICVCVFACVCSSLRKMASRQSSLLILALPGPSHGKAYQERSTLLKVNSNLASRLCSLLAPFYFCPPALALLSLPLWFVLVLFSCIYLMSSSLFVLLSLFLLPSCFVSLYASATLHSLFLPPYFWVDFKKHKCYYIWSEEHE